MQNQQTQTVKSNGWEVGIPLLQIISIIIIFMLGVGAFGSSRFAFITLHSTTIMFGFQCVTILFSVLLYIRSQKSGKRFSLLALIVSFIVPLILFYIYNTYSFT